MTNSNLKDVLVKLVFYTVLQTLLYMSFRLLFVIMPLCHVTSRFCLRQRNVTTKTCKASLQYLVADFFMVTLFLVRL